MHTYNLEETRSGFVVRWLALKMTLGLVAFLVSGVGAITLAAPFLTQTFGEQARSVLAWVRWPLLALAVAAGVAVVYRYAPNRRPPEWAKIKWGASLATVLWLVISFCFGLYSSRVGSMSVVTGALGGAFAFLLWMLTSTLAVLIGAELNEQLERDSLTPSERRRRFSRAPQPRAPQPSLLPRAQ